MSVKENRPFTFTQGSNEFRYAAALGEYEGVSIVNKFGFNNDVDTADEEIIASFGGTFDASNIITTAQTFTITYDTTTNGGDGSTGSGARALQFQYIDGDFEEQIVVHVLGSSGSDETSFTGLGINRCVVVAFGGDNVNNNDITITSTDDATIQAQIVAGASVTQQCIYHTAISKNLMADWLIFSVRKLSGGGSPRVTLRGYSFSRVTSGIYKIFETGIDTSVENTIQLNPSQPFPIGGREVLYFTADTDSNNTEVSCRFSGVVIPSLQT